MSLDVLNGCDMKDEGSILESAGYGGGQGPRPERVYNYAKLLELKHHPLALIWPPYLDPVYKNARGVWDPDRWHLEQKRGETPAGEEKVLVKDRLSAPHADGIKGAEDMLILSPQRGSFLSGCQAAKEELNLRPDQPGGRRVGSGRILRQEKEVRPARQEKEDFHPSRGSRVRNERENPRENPREWDRDYSKYGFRREDEERRGGGGSWDDRRDVDDRRGRGGRGGQGGGRRPRHENEPEWLHETVNLKDIMELRGFEDPKARSRPNSRHSNKSGGGGGGQPPAAADDQEPEDGFNFDQIMESMNLNSLLGGIGPTDVAAASAAPSTGSRFSQFFQGRVENTTQSRRSSIQDELLGNNILREINGEPIIKIPSPEESNKYFTPISPAAKTGHGHNVLLDMLQKKHAQKEDTSVVQNIEDDIKRSLGLEKPLPPPPQPQQNRVRDNDLSAFKKLVAQVKGGPVDAPPRAYMPGLVRPTPIPSLPPNMLTEQEILEGRAMHHQQQQQHQQQHRPNRQPLPPPLMQFLDHYQLNPDVLKRPEAEHLLTCLNNGTYPLENILQQLSNPALQPRQRELILSVLKIRTMSRNFPPPLQSLIAPQMMARTSPHEHLLSQPPPPPLSRVSPLMFGIGGNHLAVSPGPPQAQRVPSPQEMTMLTQQILQQALIKKKLEEQKENYRKKQEGKPDKEDKENIRGVREGPTSGSPLLAFTPTSVMRKNAAERKDSDPRPGVPELKITGQESENGERGAAPPSPGRALKGKGSDRPGSLDLGGRSTRNTPGLGNPPHNMMAAGQGMPGPIGPGGHGLGGPGMVGMPGNMQNPLMFLQNQMGAQNHQMGPAQNHQMGPGQNHQMGAAVPPGMLGQGGLGGFGHGMPPQHQPSVNNGNMGGLSGLFGGHFQHPGLMGGGGIQGLRVGPPSPRGQTPLSPGSTLGRFFSNDMLAAAAAAGGSRQMKMPPLPTGQALTLEEIERQAATVKI